jgi:hypothetical protein
LDSPSALKRTPDSLLGPKARSIPAWGEAPGTGTKQFKRAVSLGYIRLTDLALATIPVTVISELLPKLQCAIQSLQN